MVNVTLRKLAVLCAVATIATALVGCKHEASAPRNGFHPYTIKHAILHFQYYGSVRGTEDLYFDNYGVDEARDEHSELIDSAGFRPKFAYTIKRGPQITIVDSMRGQCVRFNDPMLDSIFALPESSLPSPTAQAELALKAGGFHRQGDTTILGYSTQRWQQGDHRSFAYLWNNVVLGRLVEEGPHPNELRLVSIDTSSQIAATKFVPPSNFPLKDLPPPRQQRMQ